MQSYTNNETTKLTGAAQAQSEKPSQAEDAAHGGAPGGATGQKPPLSPTEDDGIVSAAPIIPSFDEMGLPMPLLRGIYAYGFEKPSAIQQRAIKPLMDGRDTIAQAQSGTGKTAAFGIGAISRVDVDDPGTQAIILSPTRELAVQTNNVIKALGDYTGVTTHACVGGTSAPAKSRTEPLVDVKVTRLKRSLCGTCGPRMRGAPSWSGQNNSLHARVGLRRS